MPVQRNPSDAPRSKAPSRVPVSTRAWRRPRLADRRWRIAGICLWLALTGLIVWFWVFSWFDARQVGQWERAIEIWWEPSGGSLSWWEEGDLPFHLGVTAVLSLATEMGRWLLRPGWPPFSGVAVALVVATVDELLQGLSAERSCDWRDLANDALGAFAAFVVICACGFLWRRVRGNA